MDRELLARPLLHALMALWAVGLLQLGVALNRAAPTAGWVVSASLGALVALLLAERLRKAELLPVAVIMAAAAVLGGAYVAGLAQPPVLATLLAVTALGIWQLTVVVAPRKLLRRLLGALMPAHEQPLTGPDEAEGVVHRTCLVLAALSLAGGSALTAAMSGVVIHLPVLAVSLVFMWLTASRYRRPWQAHVFVALCAVGAMAIYLTLTDSAFRSAGEPRGPFAFAFDGGVALVLSLFAALAWAGTRVLRRGQSKARAAPADAPPGIAALFARPLALGACVFALLAMSLLALVIVAGTFYAPGWAVAATLLIAATVLLLANHVENRPVLTPLGVVAALFGIGWAAGALLHGVTPLTLWPFGPAGAGEWVVIALLGVGAVWLAAPARMASGWMTYAAPLQAAGIGIQLWVFAGACALLIGSGSHSGAIFGLLMLGTLAPVRHVVPGGVVRGVVLVILATLVWVALLGGATVERLAWPLLAVWGFALWAIAHGVLGRFNRRWPACTLASAALVWPGLLFVFAGAAFGLGRGQTSVDVLASVLAVAAYAFLMTRDTAWRVFEQLSAAMLVAAGWTATVLRHLEGALSLEVASLGAIALETTLWANGVLLAVWLWSKCHPRFCDRFDWRAPALRAPVLLWVFGLAAFWVVCAAAVEIARWQLAALMGISLQVPVWLLALFAVTALHVYGYLRSALTAHVLIVALLCVASALWWSVQPSGLPLLLASCGALAMLFLVSPWARSEFAEPVQDAARYWFALLAAGSLAVSVLMPGTGDVVRALAFAMVTAMTGWHGIRHGGRMWLYGAAAALVGFAHVVLRVWLPDAELVTVLPWNIVGVTALAWLAERWSRTRRAALGDEVGDALASIWPWVAGLASAEWALHLASSFGRLAATGTLDVAGAIAGHAAAVAGSLALAWLCVRRARHKGADAWMYAAAAFVASAMVYVRLVGFGLSPPGPADTAAIVGASYALFALSRVWRSRALWHLTMLVPLLAIATVPLQLGSAHGAVTLVAIGTLYLLARRSSGAGTPLYLGLLAINASIYLWVPRLSDEVGLVQLYAFPAALTVLWLLHLHRRELNPAVLGSARLAALATLYAAAGADVFLQDSIAVFALALGLAIVGIALGIGLRVRAFLYAGIAFLVLNVIGQMLVFYPEHRLARAAILMGVGVTVTGAMVWFSLKRELVLERLRLVRADLAKWS